MAAAAAAELATLFADGKGPGVSRRRHRAEKDKTSARSLRRSAIHFRSLSRSIDHRREGEHQSW